MNAPAAAAADARALAAQALAQVAFDGVSLRAAFAASSPRLRDARDRALLSALLHGGARWWLRFLPAIERLLERPLPARERELRALLVLGLVQLEVLQLPAYAAVGASVETARTLRLPAFAGLVNALLRRWSREREVLLAALDAAAVTRSAHPQWLLDAFAADWRDDVERIVAANNAEAPLWVRVNRRRGSHAALAEAFAAAGIPTRPCATLADALILGSSTDVTRLPGYADGAFSVQDGAAQYCAELLDLHDGLRVLDACAAPGGKSAHMLECADIELLALDRDARRLPRLQANLQRLRLESARVELRAADAVRVREWWDGRPFDRILLDAPCTATGIIRRQPDVKLHRRASDVAPLVATQAALLDALWPLLKQRGRLVYATCSLLADENERQIAAFAARHADARCMPHAPPGWRAGASGAQNLPGEHEMDGFFYAVLEKV